MHDTDLLLIHTAVTWALMGLIWTIQLVQYPGFAHVGDAEFRSFHDHHCSRITWIVAPLMLCELLTGLVLLWDRPEFVPPSFLGGGLALIGINWACTAFLAAPLHKRLSSRAPQALSALIAANWVRTVTWSARGVLMLFAVRATLVQA